VVGVGVPQKNKDFSSLILIRIFRLYYIRSAVNAVSWCEKIQIKLFIYMRNDMFCFKVVTDSQPAARRYLQTKLSHTDRQRVKYLLQVWLIINSQYGSLNGRVGPRGLNS